MKFKNIIWDWNGTLFDDVDVCIQSMNTILARNNLPEIESRDRYREIFCFPVKEYYAKLGFDFELTPFESLAHEYIFLYEKGLKQSQLFPSVLSILEKIKGNGSNQHIISASKQESLMLQMSPFTIHSYFTSINGLQDHFAISKADVAKNVIKEIGNDSVFIGDTLHDWEVAKEVDCPCILIANGHQNKKLLASTSAIVIDNIEQIVKYI